MKKPRKTPVVIALGISHRDVILAKLWLRWVSFLCTQKGGDSHTLTLIVFGTRRLTTAQWGELKASITPSSGMFKVEYGVCPDEQEAGYPGSASHLFLRTLEYCEQNHPGCAVLWCENDTVAMRPGWAQEIISEYQGCGKPFMGDRADQGDDPHMTGNGVYPPNWRELAPLIVDSAWPRPAVYRNHKNGLAWDHHARKQIAPLMHAAKSIQQVWRPQVFTNLVAIRPSAALFHQCKDGSLISVIARSSYPAFLDGHQPRCFMLEGRDMSLNVSGVAMRFVECARNYGNGSYGVYKSASGVEELLLLGACGKRGLVEISEEDYAKLMAQRLSLQR